MTMLNNSYSRQFKTCSRIQSVFKLTFFWVFSCLAPQLAFAACSTESTLLDHQYIGACGYTQSTAFTLTEDTHITRIRIWYDTSVGGDSLSATLNGPEAYSNSSGVINKGSCQWTWCEANWPLEQTLKAGTYTLSADSAAVCSNPSGDTTLALYGCAEAIPINDSSIVAISMTTDAMDYFYPAPDVDSQFLTHSYNPMDNGDNIFESSKMTVGVGGVRVENLMIGGVPHWADLLVNVNHPSLPLEIQNLSTGTPPDNYPQWKTSVPGVDFNLATADVFGPPLQVTFFNVGIDGASFDFDFVMDDASGLFLFKDSRPSGYLHYLAMGDSDGLGVVTQNRTPPVLQYADGLAMSPVDFGDRLAFLVDEPNGRDDLMINYGDRTMIQPFAFYYGVALGAYIPAKPLAKNKSARALSDFFWGRSLTQEEKIDQCITHKTQVITALKADNDMQTALYDLAFAMFGKLKISTSTGDPAFVAVKSFIEDSKDGLAEMMSNGKITPETLTVLIGTSIVKNATPEQHKKMIEAVWGENAKNMPEHLKTLAGASGNAVETQYKQALLAFTEGAVSTAFPLLSASAKTIIQAKKMGD